MTKRQGEKPPAKAQVSTVDPADVAMAGQLACLLEVSAPKPGNVSPGRHFADAHFEDYLASAAAIGAPLAAAGSRPLGETILLAVESTSRWTRSNTNLGIVLLLAPLARAALTQPASPDGQDHAALRDALRQVLDDTTVDDARAVYAAIRLADPGGLGRAEEQDVIDEPTATLVDVMRLAAHRDGVAREYASAFEVTFESAVPALIAARADGLSWDDAIVETFLMLLAENQDTHVLRRAGAVMASEVSRLAGAALDEGGVRSEAGMRAIDDMDRQLRDSKNTSNPGTTADLTAAAVFVTLLSGGWKSKSRT